MGEDIIDMDLNMEGGRKETDEEGKEIAAGTDRSASEQTAPYEAEAAGTEQHIEDDEEIPQLIMEHSGEESGKIRSIQHLDGMYQKWFLDYASYVILERAVPYVNDGLKPVQRRILHSMRELDDGRYNKVANIIGNTMKYHPHGDASIGDALVQLGQKDLLIDCQGNWGNILTGDGAAAPRYIEARLSKFALEPRSSCAASDGSLRGAPASASCAPPGPSYIRFSGPACPAPRPRLPAPPALPAWRQSPAALPPAPKAPSPRCAVPV